MLHTIPQEGVLQLAIDLCSGGGSLHSIAYNSCCCRAFSLVPSPPVAPAAPPMAVAPAVSPALQSVNGRGPDRSDVSGRGGIQVEGEVSGRGGVQAGMRSVGGEGPGRSDIYGKVRLQAK